MPQIWTNGCYDILHIGHIRLFEYAQSLGTLTVGIDSDERVKQLKGSDRPINSQDIRKEMLMSIKFIDNVVIFSTEEELSGFIHRYADEMVIGSEYKDKRIIGAEHVKQVHFFEKIEGFSTSNIISDSRFAEIFDNIYHFNEDPFLKSMDELGFTHNPCPF